VTKKELIALDFVRERLATTGICPSLDEIAAAIGSATKSCAWRVVDSLVRQRQLVRQSNKHRGLALPKQPSLVAVPTEVIRAELQRRERAGNMKEAA